MELFVLTLLTLAICISLFSVQLRVRKLWDISPEPFISPVLERLDFMEGVREQSSRVILAEIVRLKQEERTQSYTTHVDHSESVNHLMAYMSSALGELVRSNEQMLDLLSMEVREAHQSLAAQVCSKIDGFTLSADTSSAAFHDDLHVGELVGTQLKDFQKSLITELCFRMEGLVQPPTAPSAALQEDLRSRLAELSVAADAIKRHYALHNQETEIISSTIRLLQADGSSKISEVTQQLRDETGAQYKALGDSVSSALDTLTTAVKEAVAGLRDDVNTLSVKAHTESEGNLNQVRHMVDEKLQGALESRFGQSFKLVMEHLEVVSTGLAEMNTLTTEVGDLKRVLSNVSTQGAWGEVQLGAILENALGAGQFERHAGTSHRDEHVDYSVRLPGDRGGGRPLLLPIDAGFPLEYYQALLHSCEGGDVESVESASRRLEASIRDRARVISERFISPPQTTDFAVMFLCTEGLYVEVLRRPGFVAFINNEYHVLLAGPNTMLALLSAIQAGFRASAHVGRSNEAIETLASIKSEIQKYGDFVTNVKLKLREAQITLVDAETRANVIQHKLRDTSELDVSHDRGVRDVEEALEDVPMSIGA
jgi:DNA recombination protein RmuC